MLQAFRPWRWLPGIASETQPAEAESSVEMISAPVVAAPDPAPPVVPSKPKHFVVSAPDRDKVFRTPGRPGLMQKPERT
jgi:hypothetical protein